MNITGATLDTYVYITDAMRNDVADILEKAGE